jgi:uncharacterized membrane protein (DUF485 family)
MAVDTRETGRDWEAVEHSERFVRLTRARRRLVSIGLTIFVVWYGGFLICAAYARGFMGESIYRGFTVAYAFALSLILMTWLVGWGYVRAARTQLDPDEEEIAREVSS